MHKRLIWVLIQGLASASLLAGNWKEDGKPVPDTEWAKSSDDFGAQLAFTDKPEELFAAWERPGEAVIFSAKPTAVRGIPIVAVIFFAGCGAGPGGTCDTTVRFTAERPDGKPWGDPIDADLWVGKPPPDKGQVQLSAGNMGIIIEPGDSLGVYKVKAVIMDKVTKKRMVLDRSFAAIEGRTKSLQ